MHFNNYYFIFKSVKRPIFYQLIKPFMKQKMKDHVVLSTEQEDFDYVDINVPCQKACPASTNIPAYIQALSDAQYDTSYDINRRSNIFPGVLGRICSRPCENLCRHGEDELGEPVNICHIKRAAADFRDKDSGSKEIRLPDCNKKVAVIGAGPAGLAAAHDLALNGVSVTIFESFDHPGGMLRYGIPEFRLPRNIIREEIDQILQLGVTLKTGIKVGEQVTLEEMQREYDAVLIATGCYKPNHMDIEGETLDGVFMGLDFMIDVCSEKAPTVGKRVIVVGAGFTAFDCARSALRLEAEEVMICLRRTEEDLTVTEDEVFQAKSEGIKISPLMLSRRIMGNHKIEGVEFVRTRLGETGKDGKQRIVPIEGSEFVLPADTLIVAAGQGPELMNCSNQQIVSAEVETFKASTQGVYLTGDYLTGPTTAIEAIALGRKAAEKITRDLTGKHFREKAVRMQDTTITHRQRSWDFIPRQEMPTINTVEDRLKDLTSEVETGFTEQPAKEESKRCYLCYLHYEIDLDRCIYCSYCIDLAPRDCIKLVEEIITNENGAIESLKETTSWKNVNAVVIDNKRCIRCGECVRICPVDCISVTKVELEEENIACNIACIEQKGCNKN